MWLDTAAHQKSFPGKYISLFPSICLVVTQLSFVNARARGESNLCAASERALCQWFWNMETAEGFWTNYWTLHLLCSKRWWCFLCFSLLILWNIHDNNNLTTKISEIWRVVIDYKGTWMQFSMQFLRQSQNWMQQEGKV